MLVRKTITHQGVYYSDPIHGYADGSDPLTVTVVDYSDDGDIVTRDTKTGTIKLIPRNNFNMCFVTEADYKTAQELEAKLIADEKAKAEAKAKADEKAKSDK